MYVARRELKVVEPGGVIKIYRPGDVVPDFAQWPEIPKRAHLNMNFVEKVGEDESPKATAVKVEAPVAKAKPKKKAAATAS